ncbi:MAG: hypothetical protein ACI9H6_000872 [Patiriisocius sp.]|jgi:hypothetical protein
MNYTCPFCSTHTTILDGNSLYNWNSLYGLALSKLGRVGVATFATTCPNKECQQLYLECRLSKKAPNSSESTILQKWVLLPESLAKILPDYVPEVIREDYLEACRIKELSPKASATLARRCLQGMIRDFHGISKGTLKAEIDELEALVHVDVWESIDAIRTIGNIGAHMEQNINVIVEVEPEEAQLLIELIEQMIDEWYVSRHQSELRTQKIKALAQEKQESRKK